MKRLDPRKRYSGTGKFDWPEAAQPRFSGLMPRAVAPRPGYVLHRVREGDRLDRLAQHYFGDPRLWYAIAEANPGLLTPDDLLFGPEAPSEGDTLLKVGTELRIPPRPEAP
jgi:nucleoid-associated protein YgaU